MFAVGLLEILGLAGWWLWTGNWVALSFVDAIGLIDPGTSALTTLLLSGSDVLYFVFADTPLYGWLLGLGATLFVIAKSIGSFAPVPIEE